MKIYVLKKLNIKNYSQKQFANYFLIILMKILISIYVQIQLILNM